MDKEKKIKEEIKQEKIKQEEVKQEENVKTEKKANKEKKIKTKNAEKKEGKLISTIKNVWLKEKTLTILMIISVIAAYIAINMVVQALDIADLDLTKQKLYSISEETKNQINKIDKEINMYMFGYEEDSSVVDIVKQYARHKENIKMELVSIESRPDLANEYGITSSDESYQTILFESEGRTVTANYYDFYTYDYNTGEYIDLTEQKITNSLLAVTLENAPKVYFLTGHSEYNIEEILVTFAEELEQEVNEVATLDLLVTQNIPEDCQALIIASPQTDFTDFETNLIIEYINNGGDILWMSDYLTSGKLTNTQKILDLYGVTVYNDGILLEKESTATLMQSPEYVLPTINKDADITSPFATSGKVLLLDSGKIEVKGDEELETLGVTVTPLLTSSSKAFYRTDLTIQSLNKTDDEEEKEYILGALASKTIEKDEESVTSNLVVYANNLFASDYPLQIQNQYVSIIYLYNNRDLVLNSVSYLTERTDTITIRKTIEVTEYSPTDLEDTVVKIIIFSIPLVIVIAGIIVWVFRRRRKNK